MFYLKEGTIKLTVLSAQGKLATIALLNSGDFAGGRMSFNDSVLSIRDSDHSDRLRFAANHQSRDEPRSS